MNLLEQIKNAAIKLLGLADDATDAEVHDSLLQIGTMENLKEQIRVAVEDNVNTGMDERLSGLQAEVDTLKTKVDESASNQNAETESAISAIEARVTALESALESANSELAAAKAKITTLSSELAGVKAGVKTQKSVVDPGLKTPAQSPKGEEILVVNTPLLADLVLPKKAGAN